jgi:TRAP-type transport system periplasmic protein
LGPPWRRQRGATPLEKCIHRSAIAKLLAFSSQKRHEWRRDVGARRGGGEHRRQCPAGNREERMRERLRIFLCGAVAALLSIGIAAGARAEEITLKAASAFPKSHENTLGFLHFIDAVNKAGKGLVHINFIGGPEIAPPQQQPVALRNGLFDLLYGPAAYYLGLFPEGDFTSGFKTPMEARKLGGYKLVDEAMRQKLGATFLARFDSGLGLYMCLEEKPTIRPNGLPDLTGMKIRSSPAYRDFIKELGATAVVMPITEIYTALERGTVQGAGGDLDTVREMGLTKFLKYRIEPPFNMAGILVIANAKKWDGLPEKVRDLLQTELMKYEKITMDDITERDHRVKAELGKLGQKVIELKGEQAKNYVEAYMKTPWGRMKANPNIHINVDQLKKDWY